MTAQYRVPHKIFGWSLKPGASYIYDLPEGNVSVSYNSLGWRDSKHHKKNKANKVRVLVLGDSFMEGYSVKLKETFHKKLEKKLLERNVNIEVINFGVGGYGTLQEYLVLRDLGMEYKPDLIILGFLVGNDIRNNSLSLENLLNNNTVKVFSRPFLDKVNRINDSLIISNVRYTKAMRKYKASLNIKHTFVGELKRNSGIIQALIKIKNMYLLDKKDRGKNESLRKNRYLALFGVNYCVESPLYRTAWDNTVSILKKIQQLTKRNESKLLVFSIPLVHEVVNSESKKIMRQEPLPGILCLKNPPGYIKLKKVMESLDINYLDLLGSFRKFEGLNNGKLYYKSDRHWTSVGHELAATRVTDFIIEKKLLLQP